MSKSCKNERLDNERTLMLSLIGQILIIYVQFY